MGEVKEEPEVSAEDVAGKFEYPVAALLELVRRSHGHLPAVAQLHEEGKLEYAKLLLATTPREFIGQGRRYYFAERLNGSGHEPEVDDRRECTREEANLVGSMGSDGRHRPLIDLDEGVQLVPSSTAGHYHLYLDTEMSWSCYLRLLEAMRDAGVVSHFFVKAAMIREQTFVRPPWVKKPEKIAKEAEEF